MPEAPPYAAPGTAVEAAISGALEDVSAADAPRQIIARVEGRKLCLSVTAARRTAQQWQQYSDAAAERAALSGDRLLPVVATGQAEGKFYVAYDTRNTRPLSDARALSPAECLQLLWGVARGLDQATAEGFYPAEVTPDSVFVDRSRGAHLAELGVARAALGNPPASADAHAAWVAPEILRGEGAGERSAVFSFGALMFTLLTGVAPHEGRRAKIARSEPPSLLEVRPDLPEALQLVVSTAMAREPERRYQTASEARSLAQIVLQGDLHPAMPSPSRAPRFRRAHDPAPADPAKPLPDLEQRADAERQRQHDQERAAERERERAAREKRKDEARAKRAEKRRTRVQEATRKARERDARRRAKAEQAAHRAQAREAERMAQAEEAARRARAQEAERKAQADEAARQAQAQEAERKAQAERAAREAKRKAQAQEAEHKAQAERAAGEAKRRAQAEEPARRAQAEEAAREAQAQEAKRKAQAERAAREAKRQAQAEEAACKAQAEQAAREAQRKAQADEAAREAKRKAQAREAARKKREREARRKARAGEAKRRAEPAVSAARQLRARSAELKTWGGDAKRLTRGAGGHAERLAGHAQRLTRDAARRAKARAARPRTATLPPLSRSVPLALVAGAVAVGALGGVLLGGPGDAGPPTPQRVSSAGMAIKLPAGWERSAGASGALAAHPADDPSSGLSLELVDAPIEREEQATPVRLGRLEAWREPAAEVAGARNAVRYVVPTETGKLVVTCRASAQAAPDTLALCERAASTLRLRAATGLPLAAVVEQQERWQAEVSRLDQQRASARAKLAGATRPAGQRLTAEALARVHERGAERFAALPGGEGVASAARSSAAAYTALASAAGASRASRWNAARERVRRTEAELRRALDTS